MFNEKETRTSHQCLIGFIQGTVEFFIVREERRKVGRCIQSSPDRPDGSCNERLWESQSKITRPTSGEGNSLSPYACAGVGKQAPGCSGLQRHAGILPNEQYAHSVYYVGTVVCALDAGESQSLEEAAHICFGCTG
ncbi:hypothetical protein SKAU_G00093840 [Synaphobranchus kaupii]|uniref:Uncharacterized protein n=1 Tax=Synaphobranchus kaupii TaxID=118154 RepID=A0A9Q1FX85_SYNKA|nr:hypothetical protein SKAU_G00093840 [Synaphobranchus kaupii]